jgi:transcription initiation factor TFIID TATA-box-binding protein
MNISSREKEPYDFKITNVVVSTKLDKEIDIENMALKLNNVDYDPTIWCGLVWRREDPKATIILFANGKITSVGAKSEKDAKLALTKAIGAIPTLLNPHFKKPDVVNVVAFAYLHKIIDIKRLIAKANEEFKIIYEPEKFPAAICKTTFGKFQIFNSGNISITGAKSEEQAKKSMDKLIEWIEDIQCNKV